MKIQFRNKTLQEAFNILIQDRQVQVMLNMDKSDNDIEYFFKSFHPTERPTNDQIKYFLSKIKDQANIPVQQLSIIKNPLTVLSEKDLKVYKNFIDNCIEDEKKQQSERTADKDIED